MDLIRAEIQISAARHLRWLLDHTEIIDNELICTGWALSPLHPPEDVRFLVNGIPMAQVDWPLPSEHLAKHFEYVLGSEHGNFVCRHPIKDFDSLFPGGYARLSLANRFGEHRQSSRHSWYLPDPRSALPVPEAARIVRVIGVGDRNSYLLGGATISKRLEGLLMDRVGQMLSSFGSILDWGCGSGRLTRHLIALAADADVAGADIDADNIAWCRDNLSGAEFVAVGLQPPTIFRDGQFGLVVGCSVMTHLAEDEQFRWLAELARLTRPGGIVLLSIEGRAQIALYRSPPEHYVRVQREGFVVTGLNPQLNGMIEDPEYYKNVFHSHEYILARWQVYFDVLDIIEAIAGNQDLVLMRRR